MVELDSKYKFINNIKNKLTVKIICTLYTNKNNEYLNFIKIQ